MATIDLGKVALVWKGTYAAGTTYESKDVVQFTDSGEVSSYIYVNASGASGQTPSTGGTVNTTYWNKMAGGAAGIWASGLSLGTAGQIVQVNSGATALEFGTASAGLQSIQSFSSTGTYTKPSGINKVKVIVTGGGGGGGAGNPNYNALGGGGAGGTAIKVVDVSSISTVAVTVGSGGSGGTGGNGGGAGGTTSFGSHCSATGGYGGTNAQAISSYTRGTGSGGDINIQGGDGTQYEGGLSSTDEGGSTDGGSSYWGGGGMGDQGSASYGGTPGRAYGSGGGGGQNNGAGTSSDGGAGKIGVVYIEEYA
jgi:hypothetical protein